jgi:hypothetical protein
MSERERVLEYDPGDRPGSAYPINSSHTSPTDDVKRKWHKFYSA